MRKHKNIPWTGPHPPPRNEWPSCPQCGKALRPSITREWGGTNEGVIGQYWSGHFQGYGHFDTMRCAVRFANQVVEKWRRE